MCLVFSQKKQKKTCIGRPFGSFSETTEEVWENSWNLKKKPQRECASEVCFSFPSGFRGGCSPLPLFLFLGAETQQGYFHTFSPFKF